MAESVSIWIKIRMILLNKYLIVFVVYAVFVTFFDEHNLIHRYQSYRKIQQMEKEYKFYQDEIKTTKQKKIELQSSDENLEKFAREHYYLKKDNEDIFIINE
jgi:cell division protein FtsB